MSTYTPRSTFFPAITIALALTACGDNNDAGTGPSTGTVSDGSDAGGDVDCDDDASAPDAPDLPETPEENDNAGCEPTGEDSSINDIDEDCDGIDGPDADGDGVVDADAGGEDCDDTDPDAPLMTEDEDCDGLITEEDCDDTDSGSTAVAEDADCDGLITEEDCDDTDALLGDIDDPECDGIPTHAGGGDLLWMSATELEVGCTDEQPGCYDNEFNIMPVTLTTDYFLGETEVTQGEYEAVMSTNPSYFDDCGADCPIERISWHMAAAYTNALSTAADLETCYTCTGEGDTVSCEPAMSPYTCAGYRLPTEAEWENAARCDTVSVYAGSDDVDEVGWSVRTSDSETHPVGALLPNSCGFYDLSGNVIEWTQDWYAADYYSADGRVDPVGAEAGDGKSVRGGGWNYSSGGLRVSYRNVIHDTYRVNFVGFRVARTRL
ncbi:MAG TPA: hypothetical protein DFR83_05530 [Deltaproteobacteria bacterium]|nr:hypothetical protein [Deltaproteobacteria bacterium]